jgi:copper chaperone CopZ
MKTVTYIVPSISCGHCVHTIKTEVRELAGVRTVEADWESKVVTIGYDDPATQAQIEALLEEIDYPVAK